MECSKPQQTLGLRVIPKKGLDAYGYVSENIYLYCAANGLATCACGLIDRDRIAKWIGLPNIRVMLVHPIGIKKEK